MIICGQCSNSFGNFWDWKEHKVECENIKSGGNTLIEFCSKCGLVSITVLRMNGKSLCSRCTNEMKVVDLNMDICNGCNKEIPYMEANNFNDQILCNKCFEGLKKYLCKHCNNAFQTESLKEQHEKKCAYIKLDDPNLVAGTIKGEDIINKPNHYHSVGIDPITIAESMFTKEEIQGFYKVNMLKYWFRAGKKEGNSKDQDLQKYEFYSNKLKESVER